MTDPQRTLFDPAPWQAETPRWELEAGNDRLVARVTFNSALDRTFDYLIPDAIRELLQPGQRVEVPFGVKNKATTGYCVDVLPLADLVKADTRKRNLKSVGAILDREPLLSPRMMSLTQWIAERYFCSWGQVLDSVIPASVKRQAGTREVLGFTLTTEGEEALLHSKLTAKQRTVLNTVRLAEKPIATNEITGLAKCGTGVIQTLRNKGWIAAQRTIRETTFETPLVVREPDLTLNDEQQQAVDTILKSIRKPEHETFLLHGVTGSGKTEVYIQAIREVVSYGRQAIVLVPEISLTPQTIRRFRSRFDSVAVLHSHLTDVDRHWQWQQIARGGVQVIVGARSAVFAPTPNLGLIVIDEEHETSFKQESAPRYHAREVARKRAELENVPLILGSATPTLESWQRVQAKHDTLIQLMHRVERRPLPPVSIVDIRQDMYCSKGEAIGRALTTAIHESLEDKGQVILFLNLRGHSPTLWCKSCGETVQCPHCDISLTWHREGHRMLCHFCEYESPPPTRCPKCGKLDIRYLGIGTQRLEQEVRAKFSGAKCMRMDSDSMKKRGSHDLALEAFRKGEVQILLGTQMIAKGLDFPQVTLVGVISADTTLHQPDFRATERTFQLIAQVAGRTGRGSRGGRVLVQTNSPTEPCIVQAAHHDYLSFVKMELEHRQARSAPPFVHFVRMVLKGKNEELVKSAGTEVVRILRSVAEKRALPIRFLGPAPAPILKLQGLLRYHLLLASPEIAALQQLWHDAQSEIPAWDDIDWMVDVDPTSMR
ncbi:MAG: primosomal protein N' [Planctomycetota bacterium]|nr:primosomal protein N' [Planctomycetota bacterium]